MKELFSMPATTFKQKQRPTKKAAHAHTPDTHRTTDIRTETMASFVPDGGVTLDFCAKQRAAFRANPQLRLARQSRRRPPPPILLLAHAANA